MSSSSHTNICANRKRIYQSILQIAAVFGTTIILLLSYTFTERIQLPQMIHDTRRTKRVWFNGAKANTSNKTRRAQANVVLIVMWTPFFGSNLAEIFRRSVGTTCPQWNCRATNDKSLVTEADAVIFHIRDLKLNSLPKQRYPWQYYVFFLLESPVHTKIDLRPLERFFNLTMTYRLDSDITSTYAQFHPKTSAIVPGNLTKNESIAHFLTPIVARKTKLAAWFASNCDTDSKREELVTEMQKYIPVDVYGACGPHKCSSQECDQMLLRDFKFYVAFENSVCKDYVTEKFFRFNYLVVPLVMRKQDYHMAAQGSFIAVDQFTTVKEFTDYLLYLDKHDVAYMKYFEWMYTMTASPPYQHDYCQLCEKLATDKFPPEKVYDINQWWHNGGNCVKGLGITLVRRNNATRN